MDSSRFITIDGPIIEPALTLYSLTWCVPCKAARAYLAEQGYRFRYMEVDDLPPAEGFQIKRHITPVNVRSLTYPILEIGNGTFIYGFQAEAWEAAISQHRSGPPVG